MSGPIKPAKPTPFRDWKKATESALYSFANLRTLQHLPHHETSLKFLERLRDDPGVKHVMRKHKYSVGLLLEMEPAGNTSQLSRQAAQQGTQWAVSSAGSSAGSQLSWQAAQRAAQQAGSSAGRQLSRHLTGLVSGPETQIRG